jgi:hypothetical protein
MAAAAELKREFRLQYLDTEANFFLPDFETSEPVIAVPDMAEDSLTRAKTASFIGSVLSGNYLETKYIEKPTNSLFEAIQKAYHGDAEAYKMIETNVRTDAVERTIKTGIVMDKVSVVRGEDGQPMQHGQSFASIQANSLRLMAGHSVMESRTKAEARNAFRIPALDDQGYFKDHSLVVFSLAENLPEAGFYTETMSCAIQVTSREGANLVTEPAFVSGIKRTGGERHDHETVKKLYELFNIKLENKTPAEIIDTPLLIHNSLIPNGAVDVVRLWDDCSGGTFFGESKPRQDYLSYKRDYCDNRIKGFQPQIQKIVSQLISEAPLITSKTMAIDRLGKISEHYMVSQAVSDSSIDPKAFGSVSAAHIEMARRYLLNGDNMSANIESLRAIDTAQSSSCPSGVSKSFGSGESVSNNDEEDEYGSTTFKCPKGHVNHRPKHNLISNCRDCGVSVACK